ALLPDDCRSSRHLSCLPAITAGDSGCPLRRRRSAGCHEARRNNRGHWCSSPPSTDPLPGSGDFGSRETPEMGIRSFIRMLFGADTATPRDATKLNGTTEATLARSLSGLPPDERGWITFAEARILFSTTAAQYAFGETGPGRQKKHRV